MLSKLDCIMLFNNTSPLRRGRIYTSCWSVDINPVRYSFELPAISRLPSPLRPRLMTIPHDYIIAGIVASSQKRETSIDVEFCPSLKVCMTVTGM